MAVLKKLFVFALQVVAVTYTAVKGEKASGLEVKLDAYGNYSVLVGGQEWLRSAPTSFTVNSRHFSTADNTLKLLKKSAENGTDILGLWKAQNFYYQPKDIHITIKVSFKFYIRESCVIFSQHFLDPVMGTSMGNKNGLSSVFPSFYTKASDAKRPQLGFLAFGGIMFGDTQRRAGIWGKDSCTIVSGLDSGPVALFTKSGDTLVMSPFSQFMAASTVYSKVGGEEVVSWGIMGMAVQIPQDFVYSTIIYHSAEGVNKAFSGWGSVMTRYYRKDIAYRDSDVTLKYLGFWTDNGAYYYYNTEKKKTYEQTILDVKAYADELKIPYKYVQYDSWFYYKGPKEGVTNWTSMPEIFPSGIQSVWKKTGWPVSAHNRWWSDKVVYATQNGGKYNFIIEGSSYKAVPIDQKFWDFLMKTSKEWGLISYEQDWLNYEFDYITAMYSDVTLGRTWLTQMGAAAAKYGITIQYCMAPSRAALQSLEVPAVTQARVSGDYQPGNSDWKIGVTSIFVDAINVAPFKDNFWTTTDQPGNPYGKKETQPVLISLAATLSTGPVGVGDGVGYSNAALIMRSCNADGLLLQPSRPAKAINKQIIEAAFSGFQGEVWSTSSMISGMNFGIILGADMETNDSMSVGPSDAGFPPQLGRNVAYGVDIGAGGATVEFSDSKPLLFKGCTKVQFCLRYITPVIHFRGQELMLYGEMAKWVVMSPQRVSNIVISSEDVQVEMTGAPWEVIVFYLSYGGQLHQIPCLLSTAGRAHISVLKGTCMPV